MIGRLTGTIEAIGEDRLLIEVGGVGYEVVAGARTLREVAVGERVVLHIQTQMSDSMIRLYGFAAAAERAWFGGLQTVPGVGARAALAILDTLTVGDLAAAISTGDVTAVQRARGIGKTIAQRIVAQFDGKPMPSEGFVLHDQIGAEQSSGPHHAGAISALTNLGYGRSEAGRAVRTAVQGDPEGQSDEADLIRLALQVLARG